MKSLKIFHQKYPSISLVLILAVYQRHSNSSHPPIRFLYLALYLECRRPKKEYCRLTRPTLILIWQFALICFLFFKLNLLSPLYFINFPFYYTPNIKSVLRYHGHYDQ